MSRRKSIIDEYSSRTRGSSQNPHIKYEPVEYHLEQMYPYEPILDRSTRRIRSQCNTEVKPRIGTYYVSVSANNERPQDAIYRNAAVNNRYMYYKPSPKYFRRDPVPNSSDNSIVYLKYPKPIIPEDSYYRQMEDESGDYNREHEYYQYDDQNTKYYEAERKYDYNRSYLQNDEFYYDDYAPQTSVKKQSSKIIKNANYFMKYMETKITESEKNTKYYNEKKFKNNSATPQKVHISRSYLEPVKHESKSSRKTEKKSDHSDISTIYEKRSKLQSNIPVAHKQMSNNTSCQTLISGDISVESPKNELKESYSKCTQTLQLDFTENKINFCTSGTQTNLKSGIPVSKKEEKQIGKENTFFTESMVETSSPTFSMEYVQLSKSRTNSFLCPKTIDSNNKQNSAEPFIFTATNQPDSPTGAGNSRIKLSPQKKS